MIATAEAKRTGQDPENYLDMGMIGVVFGIIGARLYYVIFSWDMYKDNLLEILNIREGGLAIYGGVIAAVLTVIIAAKVKHLSAPQIFDTIALALLNGRCWDVGEISLTERHLGNIRTVCLQCVFQSMQSEVRM